ncbi:MAG: hypothetical protein NVV63_12615 [Opitutus sp.]|nr:hypothetical protein [Opitutus sp.]
MTKLPSGESVTLWLDRQLLHVRHYDPDRDDGKRTWVFWEVFTSITKARRSYDDARRQILNRHGRKPIPSV